MKTSFCLLTATCLAFAQPAWAATDEAAKLETATAVIETLEFERTLNGLFDGLKGVFAANAIAQIERGDGSNQVAGFFERLPGGRERFGKVLGDEFLRAIQAEYPAFKELMAKEYAAKFSNEELTMVLQFFKSGAGAKWLAVSSQIEERMGQWGETAGMKAGASAFSAALERIENEGSSE